MIRCLFFAIALLSIDPVTDWLVDRQFSVTEYGYSQRDVSGMSKLIDRETHPKPVRHKGWTVADARAALQKLGLEV